MEDRPPLPPEVDAAFASLDRLAQAGLVKVGPMQYADKGPPGRVAPVMHVEEPIKDAKARVREAPGFRAHRPPRCSAPAVDTDA